MPTPKGKRKYNPPPRAKAKIRNGRRVCAFSNCTTMLNHLNTMEYCSIHQRAHLIAYPAGVVTNL